MLSQPRGAVIASLQLTVTDESSLRVDLAFPGATAEANLLAERLCVELSQAAATVLTDLAPTFLRARTTRSACDQALAQQKRTLDDPPC